MKSINRKTKAYKKILPMNALDFMKIMTIKFIVAVALIGTCSAIQAGTWTPLKNPANFNLYGANHPYSGAGTTELLTDGTVLVQNTYSNNILIPGPGQTPIFEIYPDVWKLTPDIYGNYANGTWSQAGTLPVINGVQYAPNTMATAMLADGRLVFAGGEYNGVSTGDTGEGLVEQGLAAIFDPTKGPIGTDGHPIGVWTPLPTVNFFWNELAAEFTYLFGPSYVPDPHPIGGAASAVLANGKLLIQNSQSRQLAILDPVTLTWSQTGLNSNGNQTKSTSSNFEEGWTLLPNGKVITANVYANANVGGAVCGVGFDCSSYYPGLVYPPLPVLPYPANPVSAEIYDPSTGKWSPAPNLPVPVTSPNAFPPEAGPQVLRPDGTVVFFSGSAGDPNDPYTGNNAIYNSYKNTWSVGPRFPIVNGVELGIPDGPAALLPNGNILVSASPAYSTAPQYFFEFDGTKFIPEPALPNSQTVSTSSTNASMLILPSGQVMLSSINPDVYLYTPDNQSYNQSWAPKIDDVPRTVKPGGTYKISGTLFNGMSQGAMYGDDGQNATNYPIVRITMNNTGHVFYCRTHNHSFMGVAAQGKEVYTYFDVPTVWAGYKMEYGSGKIQVIANGIPSAPYGIYISK